MRLLIAFIISSAYVAAQKNADWDTLRYRKYNSQLIAGIYQSYRQMSNEFSRPDKRDSLNYSTNNYLAESKKVTGIEINYDKINLSIGLQTKPPEGSNAKGNMKNLNAVFNYGDNRWILESAVRYFKGFYNQNSRYLDTTQKQNFKYYQQPSFANTFFRSKLLYFTNHRKFSYKAGYTCNYRQLKSAASWVLSTNVNYNSMRNDSSFFPKAARDFYGAGNNLKKFSSFGISFNAGASATLVIFKAVFINVTLIAGPEQQWRTYAYGTKTKTISYVALSADVRSSVGINLKRCYFLTTTYNDIVNYNSSSVNLVSTFLSGSFTFGWRFNVKTPEWYTKFQNSKYYQWL